MLHPLDIAVVLLWLAFTFAAGIWFSRKASVSTEQFFVSGRSLPWWVVGTSMVATTFAADTPLAVSGFVATGGIAENWVWWTFGFSGALTVFLFARLWRRAGVVTDAELAELRYGGRAGQALRVVRAAWFGVFMNLLVIAWVMRGMTKILHTALGLPEGAVILGMPAEVAIVLGLFVLTVVYTVGAGLWGVVATDMLQFVLAIVGSVALAVLAWMAVGGYAGLLAGFETHGFDWQATTEMVPLGDPDPDGKTARFLLMVGVVWWTAHNIDGGGYLAQRLFSAKDDRHALWAYLWFTIAHICVRPWPWILVGLAGMAMLGPLDDPELYFPMMMVKLLPAGLFGLLAASFLAAFMSTIDTHLNWGSSLVINDFYRRFVRPDASDAHHLLASRVVILLLGLAGALASFWILEIGGAWKLAISVTAGVGTVYIARWMWWRVNAYSEISALVTAGVCTGIFSLLAAHHPATEDPAAWAWLAAVPAAWLTFPFSTVVTAAAAVAVWVPVTLLTPPVDREHLRRFYLRVRPGGPGWRAVAGDLPGFAQDGPGRGTLLGIIGYMMAVYGCLLGVGQALVGTWTGAGLALAVAVLGAIVAGRQVARETRAPPGASAEPEPSRAAG